MDNSFPIHTPSCKIPPCKGGCQNIVCHEHGNCCMGLDSNDSYTCSPQCRGSYHLMDSLRFQYNNSERWPANWKQKFALLRKNWSTHSKFSSFSLQCREDMSDEDITSTNVSCGIFNCGTDSYMVNEASISKNNRCSCCAKNKARRDSPASSYYVHPEEMPTHHHSQFEPSERTCSRECPNRNRETSFLDNYTLENENSQYNRRNRSNSSPGRYSGKNSVHEMSTSRRRDYVNTNDTIYVDESFERANVFNRGRARGGADRPLKPGPAYDDYINIDTSTDDISQSTHPVSPNAHLQKHNKQKVRKSLYDEMLTDVISQDLSIVFNEQPTGKSKMKQSSITLSFKKPKHNTNNPKNT